MAGWFASGGVVEFILALTVVEVFGVAALHRLGMTRLTARRLLPSILAGDFLLLAWLFDVKQAGWVLVALCLLAALGSHAADTAWRWKSS